MFGRITDFFGAYLGPQHANLVVFEKYGVVFGIQLHGVQGCLRRGGRTRLLQAPPARLPTSLRKDSQRRASFSGVGGHLVGPSAFFTGLTVVKVYWNGHW